MCGLHYLKNGPADQCRLEFLISSAQYVELNVGVFSGFECQYSYTLCVYVNRKWDGQGLVA